MWLARGQLRVVAWLGIRFSAIFILIFLIPFILDITLVYYKNTRLDLKST